ncbi:unnamed protein product [Mycena citricolor]|uniref:Transmembrane protein n=1 Tax=Mycena citricolor TaxID=2018698 RepID=A0AAD2H5Z6_9AGAR|nr:unnamed protein product [Mycena citricolor]
MVASTLLALGLLIPVISAQNNRNSNSVLYNGKGQSPCEMKSLFENTCHTSRRARALVSTNRLRSSPTPCICTNVYFNLWSACAYTQNSSLPSCSTWKEGCHQASVAITTENVTHNTAFPSWAFMPLPSNNDTFDLVGAVEAAEGYSHRWTSVQIIAPVVVGVVVALSLSVGFYFFLRHKRRPHTRPWMQTTGNRPRFHFPTLSSVKKVRAENRSSTWSIDEPPEDWNQYEFVSYPPSLQGSHGGHVRLSSSPTDPPRLKIPGSGPVYALPGKSVWKAPFQNAQRWSRSIPFPWRTPRVKNVPSYKRFRVDDADSDSPLPERTPVTSVSNYGRSNLRHASNFDHDNDGDSDTEALPLMAAPVDPVPDIPPPTALPNIPLPPRPVRTPLQSPAPIVPPAPRVAPPVPPLETRQRARDPARRSISRDSVRTLPPTPTPPYHSRNGSSASGPPNYAPPIANEPSGDRTRSVRRLPLLPS